MINVEIWASGSGSNAERLVIYFQDHAHIRVKRIVTNNPKAGVIARAERLGIPCIVLAPNALRNGKHLVDMRAESIDFVILAGFLKLVPPDIVAAYENRMINVHPALLPKYGGKNMYGDHIHRAVLAAKESQTGITIHLVNEEFDKGRVLAQFTTSLSEGDDLKSLLPKIRRLEHKFFPIIVEDYLLQFK